MYLSICILKSHILLTSHGPHLEKRCQSVMSLGFGEELGSNLASITNLVTRELNLRSLNLLTSKGAY